MNGRLLLVLVVCLIVAPGGGAQDETQGWPIEERCVGEATEPPEGWSFPGVILLRQDGGFDGNERVLGLSSTDELVIYVDEPTREADWAGDLPPDQRWAVFNYFNDVNEVGLVEVYEIHVVSTVHPGEEYVVPWNHQYWASSHNFPYTYKPIRWWDNEHFIAESLEDAYQGYSPETTFLVNPFTDEITQWHGQLDPLASYGRSFGFPSPDWTRIAFNFDGDWGIYDPISGELIAALTSRMYGFEWTPDSSRFVAVVILGDEGNLVQQLTVFDRDGHLVDVLLTQPIGISLAYAGWSIDGRYFAFARYAYLGEIPSMAYFTDVLHIVDMEEEIVIDTCLTHAEGGWTWSPDGTLLAFKVPMADTGLIQVLDLESWQLFNVEGLDGHIIGWRADE